MNSLKARMVFTTACFVALNVSAYGAEIARSKRDVSGEIWTLALSTDGAVKLTDVSGAESVALRFVRAEAPDAEALLKKFRQWSSVAEKNAVTAAEKGLGTIGEKALTFRVESDERRTSHSLAIAGEEATLSPEDAREFLALLAHLPALDAEMAQNQSAAGEFPEDSQAVARNEAQGQRAELHARALDTVRQRFPAPHAQYSTLGATDDAFTSCRALEDGTWEARGVVQAKFRGELERRAWSVRLRPGANEEAVKILTAEEKPLRTNITQAQPQQR